MFQLSEDEYQNLRFHFVTSSEQDFWGRKLRPQVWYRKMRHLINMVEEDIYPICSQNKV